MKHTIPDVLSGFAASPPSEVGNGDERPGDRYLQIVSPVNEVVAMFNAANNDTSKGKVIQALSVVLASATSEIENVEWPAEVHDVVVQLVRAANAASEAASTLVTDLTHEAASVFAAEIEAMTDASTEMRKALGLPMLGKETGSGSSSGSTAT